LEFSIFGCSLIQIHSNYLRLEPIKSFNLSQTKDNLFFRKHSSGTRIFDPTRNHFYLATKEEVVRQSFIQFIIKTLNYPLGRIASEKKIVVNGVTKRFDICVFDRSGAPYILIECKAPDVPIDQSVMNQIANYNEVLKVPFLVVTNGKDSFCAKIDFESSTYTLVDALPKNYLI
jgi:hypothetical protein